MKAGSKKSSTTTSATATQAAHQPFFAKATGGDPFFAPLTRAAVPAVQMKMAVNKPGDKLEQEADKMASKVMRLPAPASREQKLQRQTDDRVRKAALPEEKIQKQEKEKLRKAPKSEEKLQRSGSAGTPAVDAGVQAGIRNKSTGGQPLSSDVRSYMEPRFQADFSNVRVHSDNESAGLSNRLSARAFTYQNNIFFSRDQYQPGTSEGKQLLAHELTHTIQQGHAVQRNPRVGTTATQPHIQRSVVGEILDWFADKANNIPGFRMFTIILGVNPINMSTVDRSAANILRALIEFMPGGNFITRALDNHGVFNKVGAWIEGKIKELGMVGQMFKNALSEFIDSLGWRDLAPWNWGDVWGRAKRIFTAPIDRLINFAVGVVVDIIKFIKDAILKPLAALAQGTRGYDLLKAILGEDPITGEPVPRNADTLIGGFMKLIGQEEIWENIKKGNAIARAWAWFQGALAGLMGFVRSIPRRIIDTLKSLTIEDILTVAGAFKKIVGAFVSIAVDFISWGLQQVLSLLEILFSVVAPGVMPYIKKAKAAFITIIKDPIGFVRNLVRAGKLGFEMFAINFVEHLKAALIKWLVGPLAEAGVYIPKSFDLIEIIKLVLSILGLTWQNIRTKLLKIIPEPVLVALEKTSSILVTLVKDGPVAAWEQIKTELSDLKNQLIAQVIQMVTTEVVKAAVVKLVTMLNPAGAVIQAIIAIYNTVTFFIQKIKQIAAVVGSFIDSIAAIAAGQVMNAAKRVERTMANTLVVVIAFLAKFASLSNIPEKVVGAVMKVRQPMDIGMDKIVAWLGNVLQKAKDALFPKKDEKEQVADTSPVIAKVKQELASRLPGTAKGKAEIQAVVNDVYTRFSPEGLKVIHVVPEGSRLAVKVSASAEVTGGVFDTESSLDLSDLTTMFFAKTILVATINGKQYKRTSGGGMHAEEVLLNDLNANWDSLGNPKTIEIDINRAPCGPALKNCAGKLSNFARTRNVKLIVRAASPYPSDPSWVEAFRTLKAEPNVELKVWNVLATLKSRYDIDPEDVKPEVVAKIENRRKRLLELREDYYRITKG